MCTFGRSVTHAIKTLVPWLHTEKYVSFVTDEQGEDKGLRLSPALQNDTSLTADDNVDNPKMTTLDIF